MPNIPIRIDRGYMPDLLPEEVAAAGGLVRATNILPVSGGYYPVRDLVTYNSTAVTGTPISGRYIQSSADANNYNFIGTSSKLYRFDSSAMTDVTRASGGDYTATFWDFASYGNWLIATDYYDVPQVKKDIEDGTVKFTALGGTRVPRAKYVLMDHGHLILGYLSYNGTVNPKQIMWSGKELPETWDYDSPTSLSTGADYQDFPEIDGVMTGLAKLGTGWAIFAENSITFASYLGGGYTFRFDINAIKNVGCFYPSSLLSLGDRAYFWSKSAMWELSSGGLKEIGVNLKRTLMNTLDFTQTDKIKVWPEPENNLILWLFITSSSTYPNKMLAYNYVEDRATILDYDCYTAMRGIGGGVVIDSLTSGNGYPVINSMNNIINTYNAGNNFQTLVFDTDSIVKTMTGDQLQAEIETGEVSDVEAVTQAHRAFIPVEGLTGASVVTPKHRYSLIDSQTSGNTSSIKSDGTADLRVSNKRHALNITLQDFTRIGKTINLEVKPAGRR